MNHQKYRFSTEVWNTFKKYKKKFWVFTIFWLSGFFRDFLKIPGIFGQSPGFGIFFSLGIFIPGIRDFSQSRDLYPRDSDFFSLGIFIPTIRDFSLFRDFYPRDLCEIPGTRVFFGILYHRNILGIFFRGMGYPDKKPPLISIDKSLRPRIFFFARKIYVYFNFAIFYLCKIIIVGQVHAIFSTSPVSVKPAV